MEEDLDTITNNPCKRKENINQIQELYQALDKDFSKLQGIFEVFESDPNVQ